MSFGMGMPASTAATLGTMADSAAAAVAPGPGAIVRVLPTRSSSR